MSERYVVTTESDSGHCCFRASVLDMAKPIDINDYHGHECVCECLRLEDARMIADALNALAETRCNPEEMKSDGIKSVVRNFRNTDTKRR